MIYTTLDKIREHDPCTDSWEILLKSLDKTKADETPLSMVYILDTLGLEDCLWGLRSLPEYGKMYRLLACDYAERVLPIFEKEYPDDKRPREYIEVTRRFSVEEATEEELSAAWAAWAAGAAGDAGDALDKWAETRLRECLEAGEWVAEKGSE